MKLKPVSHISRFRWRVRGETKEFRLSIRIFLPNSQLSRDQLVDKKKKKIQQFFYGSQSVLDHDRTNNDERRQCDTDDQNNNSFRERNEMKRYSKSNENFRKKIRKINLKKNCNLTPRAFRTSMSREECVFFDLSPTLFLHRLALCRVFWCICVSVCLGKKVRRGAYRTDEISTHEFVFLTKKKYTP